MASQVVSYGLDDDTVVSFEIESTDDFHPVGAAEVVAQVQAAVRPTVEAARAVLAKVAEIGPDEVQLKFGIKVDGSANWLIAKAATEASFEVTLTWRPESGAGTEE
ncbi:CU044_2847 family protein [Kitasatospora kifunensis]|uniref:Trypsin-co-occurring domain-containing protein n=1 Tax=Kitasatospora kifunensis TaxID=58351 RepID=A0A7W7R8N1_KITKI|nr:CU044_2847 family protein [Kitasatospora kifunensis]MBB4927396.1 hypothetical protein [Kitasatospora kifunensis]